VIKNLVIVAVELELPWMTPYIYNESNERL